MLKRLYGWYGKRTVLIVFLIIVILGVAALILSRGSDSEPVAADSLRVVDTTIVSTLSNGTTIELVGEVEAVSQATIESETSGRVTSVSVELGQSVTRGTIIAQLENASERAAVLQAEGAYEAALAGAAQSDSGVESAETTLQSAKTSGVNTVRATFTTVDDLIRNTIDIVFADPTGPTPGLRIDGRGFATQLNADRQVIEAVLDKWSQILAAPIDPNNAIALLEEADRDIAENAAFVELITQIVFDEKNDDAVIDGVSISSIRSDFTTARNALNSSRQTTENAITAIENAEDALTRAQISGTNTDVSSANAQVKQALGALRSAQANLEQTIFRSPISGTINLLDVKVGDFVGSFTQIASVANNDALEITTFVGESDRNRISVGDTVSIENTFEGVITNIAPAVDPVTKKIEVKIQSETNELANGDTVRVTISSEDTNLETDTRIYVPLTAVKFNAENGSVLKVEEGLVTSHPVILGNVSGSNVEILEGIDGSDEIIVDARGLNNGQAVDVK